MAWMKFKTVVVATAAVLAVAGTTTVVIKEASASLPAGWTNDPKYWQLDFNNPDATFARISRLPPVLVLRPTRFPTGYGLLGTGSKTIGKNQPISELIRFAYDLGLSHRLVMPDALRQGKYDIMMTLPDREYPYDKLQRELTRQTGLIAHFETNDVDVLFLKQANPGASGLVATNGGEPSVSFNRKSKKLILNNWPLYVFASEFDSVLNIPVFDQTGIDGKYNCTLTWNQRPGESEDDAFKRSVMENLGLEFVPGRKTIPLLVVEKIK